MDMRTTYKEKQSSLNKAIKTSLTPEQKTLMLLALEFGYAAAFCSRTCDMNKSWFMADTYTDEYNKFKNKLKAEQ